MDLSSEDPLFRTLFERAPDGIIVVDSAGTIVVINPSVELMFGYDREELIGESIDTLVPEALRDAHERDRAAYAANARMRAMAAGRLVAGRRKDGTEFPIEISLNSVQDGDRTHVMGVVRDLTEHVRAEEHFNRFFNLSFDLLSLAGFDGYLKRINPAWEHTLGFTADELLARPILDLVEPGDRQATTAALEQLRRGIDVIAFELPFRCRDGSLKWIQWTAKAVVAEGLIYAVGRDITERRRADAELRKTARELQAIFDSSPLALLGLDLKGRVTSWSAGAEGMFGWLAEEAIGRVCPTVPESEMDDFLSMIERVVRDGSQTGISALRRKKSGEVIHANLGVAPLSDPTGCIVGVMLVMEDMTKRVRAQETLRDYSARLRLLSQQLVRAQEEERRRIARELHDEIGQALAAVEINLQVARTSDEMTKFTPSLEESVNILGRVLQQIRELSVDLHPPLLDHLGLAAALRWQVDRQAQRAGLAARLAIDRMERSAPPEVELACFRIAQEGVTNAIRHARASCVDVELHQRENELELVVRDDGQGFDLERARAVRETLGLVGMEERVLFLGGQFTIDSSPERGTEIRALFPLGDE